MEQGDEKLTHKDTKSTHKDTHNKNNKKKKRRIPVPLLLILLVCLIIFGISAWQLSSIWMNYRAATSEYDELLQYVLSEVGDAENSAEEEPAEDGDDGDEAEEGETQPEVETVERVALSKLKELNDDTVAWIEIPGTGISYPVMHTTDNSYYLNHTFSDAVNSSGSIFEETQNSSDFSDVHTLVYGHNMKNGSMFAKLKNYASASYLVSHPTIYLDLSDGTHAYQIFSVYEAAVDDAAYTIGFAHDDIYAEWLAGIKASSAYDTGVEVTVDDNVLTLSTCTSGGQKRYVVHAKKVY